MKKPFRDNAELLMSDILYDMCNVPQSNIGRGKWGDTDKTGMAMNLADGYVCVGHYSITSNFTYV